MASDGKTAYMGKEQGREANKLRNISGTVWKLLETEPEWVEVVDGLPVQIGRIKGLGNAIVPQVAYEIFSAIGRSPAWGITLRCFVQ